MTTQKPSQSSWWSEATAVIRHYDDMESRLTAPVSERMLDLARLGPGMRVLDVAAGMGEPSLRAARRVGPSGFVLGTDLADGMLETAREKARAQGLSMFSASQGSRTFTRPTLLGSFSSLLSVTTPVTTP